MRKKNKVGGITIPDIKLYYRVTVIKTDGTGIRTGRHIDQWNRTKSPEINPSLYGQLMFDKGGMSMQWSKIPSSINGVGRTGTCKKMKLDHQFTPYTRINSKWIKDLNVSRDTVSPRGKQAGKFQISHVPVSPRAKKIKEKTNKWDYIKLKSFCTAKETIVKMKREPTIWDIWESQ